MSDFDQNDPRKAAIALGEELFNFNPTLMESDGIAFVKYEALAAGDLISFLGVTIWSDNEDPRPFGESDFMFTIYEWCRMEILRITADLARTVEVLKKNE